VYEYLEGHVAHRSAARLVLDVGGVGYDLAIPPGRSFPEAPEAKGGTKKSERFRVWVHLVVREDAQLLFGFPDRPTRDIFRILLSVRGVGPAAALGIVSGLSHEQMIEAVLKQDTAPFVALRGIGKRTAEQILLDLRDKAQRLAVDLPDAAKAALPAELAVSGDRRVEDAVGALISLGYAEKEARKQVERAARGEDAEDLEHLVRLALQG